MKILVSRPIASQITFDDVVRKIVYSPSGLQGPKGDTGADGVSSVYASESPSGVIDGVNSEFTLTETPQSGSLVLSLNGLIQRAGALFDYTLSGSMITFNAGAIPQASDSLYAVYVY